MLVGAGGYPARQRQSIAEGSPGADWLTVDCAGDFMVLRAPCSMPQVWERGGDTLLCFGLSCSHLSSPASFSFMWEDVDPGPIIRTFLGGKLHQRDMTTLPSKGQCSHAINYAHA